MSAARRWLALCVWLGLLAAAVAAIGRATFAADLSAFLPSAPDARQRALIGQLQSGAASRTLLVAIEGGTAVQRAQAVRGVAAALRASALFDAVLDGDDAGFAALGDWAFAHRYRLSPAVDAARFGADGLRDAIDESLSLLGTPAGARIKPLLAHDPTGEALRMAEASLPAQGPRRDSGVWASRDGTRALLTATTRADGADLDAQQAAIDTVRAAFAKLGASHAAGLTLLVTGSPTFAVDSRTQIESEVRWLAAAGAMLVVALLGAAFASLPALLVAALPVASGIALGVAAVAMAFPAVHGVTLGFGTALIGEGVDYGIYYLVQARATGWQAWLREGWPTVRLGLLTSLCGFAALVFSGFPGLAQLGVFSLAGLIGAAATTRFVLPVLMPDGARGAGLRPQLARVATALLRGAPRVRHAATALAVAAAALLVLQPRDPWRAELASLSPVPASALALQAQLRADLGAGDALALVVVQAADEQSALEAAEAAGARLDRLVERGDLTGYDTPTRLLPSLATQRRRIAALPDAVTLRAALAQATAGGALPAARLDPFVEDVQGARTSAPLTANALRGTPAGPLLAGLLWMQRDGSWIALLPLHAPAGKPVDGEGVRAAIDGVPSAGFVEVGAELARLYRHYLHQAQQQSLLGAAAVVLLIAAWLRSPRRVVATCVPLAAAVLVVTAGFAAAGVPLSILHLVGLLLVVAIGSNYVLFFDLLRDPRAADADTLASLLLANLTTVLSFGLLACSTIPALSAIGRVVAPGTLLALLLGAAYAGAGARGGRV